MKNEKTKKNIIIVGILLLLIIGILGVSYAVFSYTGRGERVNTITSGAISMSYEETDNIITIDGALPTTDATGTKRLKEGEYFDFTISSTITGNTNINYEISAKEVGEGTIDGSNIKLYLTRLTDDNSEQELMQPEVYNEETGENTYTGRPADEMSLYANSMSSSESNRYRLRMYVDEGYNPQGDGGGLTFSVRINVYGKSGDKMPMQTGPANEVLLTQDNIGENGSIYDDGVDTFIIGEDPNNYIWYSGKLWRAVSINKESKTTKLVTQWDIAGVPFSNSSSSFAGSYMESWLNDTSVDGFLGNLRDYENFIVTDSIWDATIDNRSLGNITRPDSTTIVENTVGLLNIYEYQTSYTGTTFQNGYLSTNIGWWTITPSNSSELMAIQGASSSVPGGQVKISTPNYAYGVRPVINLKPDVKIVSGTGTVTDPYRLKGDNDTNLSGTKLNTRYSGEYIKFGTGNNTLYRIVSHENGIGTKITSAEPLKNNNSYLTRAFGSNNTFSSTNTVGSFLNGEYLTTYVGNEYSNMIEDNTTWYLGTVGSGGNYKLAKYTDASGTTLTSNTTTAKVGLLRTGELMAGQYNSYNYNQRFWLITPYSSSKISYINEYTTVYDYNPSTPIGIKPALNLKENIVITSGEGTKDNPFIIELSN